MNVTETLSDGLKRAYTVVVPAADIEDRRSKRLVELGKTVRLPGFRPGKVPMPVMRQRYGTAVTAEVLEESVNDATRQVLADRGLRAATQPKVDVVSLEDAKDLEFNVEVELLPEIPMPDFAAIALTRLRAEPDSESVDRALSEIASRQRDFIDVDAPRPAVKGETLVVDFVGKIEGTAFPGGTASDVPVEVGGDGFIPGFTEQLEGMAPGEQRTISVTFPEAYQAAELAGKEASFEINAKILREPVAPAVDDSLATKLGIENLEALRSLLTQRMQREYDQLARMRLKRHLLDALAAQSSFPIPESMVEGEFAQIWQRIEADRKSGQLDADDAGKDDDTLKAEYRAIAERRVRLGLLLAEIGRLNAITVAPDEMNRAMRAEAAKYSGQEQQVMEFFRKNPQAAETLRGPIFEDKVVDFVLELARVTDETVTPEQLAADGSTDASNETAPVESAGQTSGDAA
jgi:trigger factor